jgi:ABC-type sugar transport system ATPase subunit
VALLPEDRRRDGLILALSVKPNVTLAALKRFIRNGFLMVGLETREVQKYVERLGIKVPSLSTPVENLSGGNQQKVVLAKWLCSQVKVLIFDEPTRGIDVGSKVEVHRLMNQLVEEGMAILMISSELPEVLGMSDRILVMRQGMIVGELSQTEATQEKILSLAMLGMESVGEANLHGGSKES